MRRVVSGVLLAATLLATIWWLPAWATLVLALVASVLAGTELAAMAAHAGAAVPPLFLGATAALVCGAFSLAVLSTSPSASPFAPLVAVLVALPLAAGAVALAGGPPAPIALTRAALLFMTPLYIGVPLGVLVWVRAGYGRGALLLPILIVAISDSAQYYSGRAMGRRKLAPAVSPSKTIEGAIGGLLFAALAGACLAPRLVPADRLPTGATSSILAAAVGAGLGSALAVAGMLGDLFESFLKRSAGVKDSSALIPGHGGVLDRIDSHLFAAPLYYLFLRYIA